MHIPQPATNSRLILSAALSALLLLPACSVNVKKDGEGDDKKVDIETPLGGIHVSKDADVRDVGLPVYPGARKKEKDEEGQEKSANVRLSSGLFGLKVVAIEYLSDDPPAKLIAYYKDQLKKYGGVTECHTNTRGGDVNLKTDSNDSNQLKCEGDNSGKIVELKAGTKQNQHLVSIEAGEGGKGSDFGLVYIQLRGKDTI